MTEASPFRAFSNDAIDFLRDLRVNNERAWFNAHKATYEREIKRPAEAFSMAMTAALEILTGRPHGHRIFRIHRDVRFSKDKTPYKSHLHIAFMPKDGQPSPPSWFFSLDPEQLTLGTGAFAFDKADLERYRKRVFGDDGQELADIRRRLEGQGIRFGKPDLMRVPSGYPADHPQADLLRQKGLTAWIDHQDPTKAAESDLVDVCIDEFKQLKPVFDWLSA